MSKHTPGEWVAVGTWVELADGDDDEMKPDICVCDPALFDQGHLARSNEEMNANAKLIALAPIMYQYLKYLAVSGDTEAEGIISSLD